MKVAVINFSGNVGKTTIARHLLVPRMAGAELIAVESINADEGQATAIRGEWAKLPAISVGHDRTKMTA